MTAPTGLGAPARAVSASPPRLPGADGAPAAVVPQRVAPGALLPGTPDLLRSVFRGHAAGVAVITARGAGPGAKPVGFTATSLTSVSADPPLVSFGAGTGSSSWPVLAEAEYVGVHLLAEHQAALAATFARSGADRFAPPTCWGPGPEGVPLLDGVLARLVCRVVARVPAGGHRVLIAEVTAGEHGGGGRPLVYHEGRFTGLREPS